MKNKHSFRVRLRAFRIWQVLGYNPWEKPTEESGKKRKRRSGDFYKGAFDTIPFLNDDAKRTFRHILLRPGYMIKDYVGGEHERYLAPLTSLIIFYAFFALVSSVLQPIQHGKDSINDIFVVNDTAGDSDEDVEDVEDIYVEQNLIKGESADRFIKNIVWTIKKGYTYLHLDQHPEEVHTKTEGAIAALENTLRSQGIPLFIGKFLILWLTMSFCLRRTEVGMAACAAASAYILCQFSFFMLFAVLLTWGKSAEIRVGLMAILFMIDYRQWLGLGWKSCMKLTLRTGILYVLVLLIVLTFVGMGIFAIAYFKTKGIS